MVEVLPDRSADSFAAWLQARPGVEVICRDRAGCYAEGAQRGAPLAVQVADQWHLLHNLSGAVQRAMSRNRAQLRKPAKPETTEPPAEGLVPAPEEGAAAARTRTRYAEIHQALATGMNIIQISRELRLDRKTVRRYTAATSADHLISAQRVPRQTILDTHLPYLHQRWEQGCATPTSSQPSCANAATWAAPGRSGVSPPSSARQPPIPRSLPRPRSGEATSWIVQSGQGNALVLRAVSASGRRCERCRLGSPRSLLRTCPAPPCPAGRREQVPGQRQFRHVQPQPFDFDAAWGCS